MQVEILHILGTAQPEGTGIARIVGALTAGLDPQTYRIHAWFLGPAGPLAADLRAAGADVRTMNWWHGARDPIGACRFWRCLRRHNFAIVHQHFGARSVRYIVRRSSDARLAVHLHGRVSEIPSVGALNSVRGADMVIAASRAVARQVSAAKPIVVYAGIPLDAGTVHHSTRSTGATTIGTACRLVRAKGVLDLIRATALLRSEFPNLRLEIAGSGPQRRELEQEVHRLGMDGHAHFLGWQSDVRRVLRNWDIFALPSLDEGFPIVVLEAMATRLPVVATSVGGIPELIEHGLTGYITPPSNISSLAACLHALIIDPERRCAMGTAGQERVRSHFSVDRMVRQVASIYGSLLENPSFTALTKLPG